MTTDPSLDYYLILAGHPGAEVQGIVVETFARHPDFTTAGLDSAGWTPTGAGWWSSASLSRSMRSDPELSARVLPTSRSAAGDAYRTLGGGQLPVETVLRTYFHDHQPIPTVPPLRLGPAQPPTGFHERRVYRVLFARDLREEQVASLRALWHSPVDTAPGSVAAGHLEKGDDQFTWDLRQIGNRLAWCLDVTVLLGTTNAEAVAATIHELTNVLRRHGLIPVTTERFA
ncbi:hypothetical protein V6V47_14840 [Micromonospora sp. CPCC 205539]|uniref:hypothetical protein n=1 Tax=Micromonospora sp. CPCC 205539 TaxID=3122408 RepID=UPI002FF22D98